MDIVSCQSTSTHSRANTYSRAADPTIVSVRGNYNRFLGFPEGEVGLSVSCDKNESLSTLITVVKHEIAESIQDDPPVGDIQEGHPVLSPEIEISAETQREINSFLQKMDLTELNDVAIYASARGKGNSRRQKLPETLAIKFCVICGWAPPGSYSSKHLKWHYFLVQ